MSKFVLEKLSFNEQDGKDIADFLSRYFHAEHSLDGGDSPRIHWGKTSWQINNVLLKGTVYVVRKNKNIIGTLGLKECSHWWSDDSFLGDTWFFVRPEFRNIKDDVKPSNMLLEAGMNYAEEKKLPLIMGIYNVGSLDKAEKLLLNKGFHQIGGTYYNGINR